MAINTLGLTQGLSAAAEGLQSGYMNALGTIYQRGLAQQKQASESGLQAAQSNWYNGRNRTAEDVASTRAAAMGSVATIKAGTAQAQMRDNALKALPGDLANLYYQQPETVKAYTDAFDRQNGTSFSSSLFPGMGGSPASSPDSGPGAPQFNPLTGALGPVPTGSPGVSQTGSPGVSSTLPPPAGPIGAPSAPSMSFSVPGVGLSGMGLNAPSSSLITGVSPALPPPGGPLGASSLGASSLGASSLGNMPAAPSPSVPSPSLGSGALPTLPPGGPIGNTSPGQNYGLKPQQFNSLQEYQDGLRASAEEQANLQTQGLSPQAAHDRVTQRLASMHISKANSNWPPPSAAISPALSPPSGPIGASSVGNASAAPSPSFGSGISPTLPPVSGPIGSVPPLANPLRQPPLAGAKIAALNAGAAGSLSKTDMLFQNSVGLLPPAQQAQATARFNQINGTNYAVPGTQTFPTLANGTPALGPPSLTPSYLPNTLQAATIAGKNAETSAIGQNYGLKVQQFKSLQDYQQALVAAKQQEIGLQRQGLSEKTAHDSVMANIAQQGVNARGSSLGGNGVAGDALTARLNQRLTTLTMPGKPDLFGKPSAPLVTLDPQGNPTGPGAAEYHSLQNMMHSRAGGVSPMNPVGGGYHLIPGVGSSVRGVSAPSVPALPGFPPSLPGASRSGAAGGYSGPIPNSQADFQRMTPQQKYDYKNTYLRGLNAGR